MSNNPIEKYKRNISLDCMKFQYGGGMERYSIDLVKGFYDLLISPTVYSTEFDTKLTEYQFINPVKINLSTVPKQIRQFLLPYLFERKKRKDNLSITTMYSQADIVICGGNHKGYLEKIGKRASFNDKLKITNEQNSLSHSKLVVAHSKLMRRELIELYNIDSSKITVIYPPVDIHKFSLPDSNRRYELRRKFGFNENEVIYLFPSTGHFRKGFDILKGYFESSDLPIRLIIAGTPTKESKNITSLGFCNNMPELYPLCRKTPSFRAEI